jgi:molybdopterin-guanine dinucleotide biosynthesis protein A
MQLAKTGGIVLCGGMSSRMGQPKAWLTFDGEALLQRVVRVMREVLDPVIVVAAKGQELPEIPAEVRILRDETGGRGPLQGLASGLMELEEMVESVYLSSCDVPFLRPEFVQRVVSLRRGTSNARHEIAVPHVGDRFHPLAAAYRVSVLPHVQQQLASGVFRLTSILDLVPIRIIEPHELADVDPEFKSLRNLNTPEEYRNAILTLKNR